MDFIVVNTYANYIDAHIQMGRLQEENIDCWLKDESIVTIDPLLTNAVGGIKLMVLESDFQKAVTLINEYRAERKSKACCPRCGSNYIEFVSTPRKSGNWLSVIFIGLLASFAPAVEKVYHCFNCGNEYSLPEEKETD